MKYDDASWHYGGEFPKGLPSSAGATHIAMFLAWCVLNGLGSDMHEVELVEELTKLKSRQVTPTEWFLTVCDEKLTAEDLSAEGNMFAAEYYGDGSSLHTGPTSYVIDYAKAFPEVQELYGVPDTWVSFDRIAPTIARRMMKWRAKRGHRRLWPL